MQIVRTIVWVVVLIALLVFTALNWRPVEVKIWENLIVETKIPALVLVSFLAGWLPMWLVHRGSKWRNQVRIATLESAVRTASKPSPAAAPANAGKGAEPANPVEPERDHKP